MDARSDVWSVATVLFEMLTAKPYFEAEASSKLEWIIRNYRALQPAIAGLPPGLREILSRALDPDLNKRFASAAAFQAALHEWRTYGLPSKARSADTDAADPHATRRTVYPNPDERTQRVPRVRSVASVRQPSRFRIPESIFHIAVPVLVALFLCAVFIVVYEIRMWHNAQGLRTEIDSGRLTPDLANVAYQALAKKSLFSFLKLPLYPARNSLRDRYLAEADRVIADYREASESTPVSLRDWRRAQTALNSAMTLSPDDKSIRGKHELVDGFVKLLKAGNLRDARADFDQARNLLPDSPDPHLGLAQIRMREGDLDKAEEELNQAKRNGFQPGRREQRDLADGYRVRGEKWLAEANRAHGLGQMQDALKHADSDLAHAEELYNSVAPLLKGVELAEKVSLEREKAAKSLAQAAQIQDSSGGNP
jgi:tetratricopeptide (TPR) repeat protein